MNQYELKQKIVNRFGTLKETKRKLTKANENHLDALWEFRLFQQADQAMLEAILDEYNKKHRDLGSNRSSRGDQGQGLKRFEGMVYA